MLQNTPGEAWGNDGGGQFGKGKRELNFLYVKGFS